MTAPQIGLGVDHDHRQPRILSLQLRHQHVGAVAQFEERHKKRVGADVITDSDAGIVDGSELLNLYAVLAEGAAGRDTDQRVLLEEDDVAIGGVGRFHIEQTASDFELAGRCRPRHWRRR